MRLARRTVALLASLLLASALAASTAGAVVTRQQVGSFRVVPSVASAAVDNSAGLSSGDVYLAEGLFGPGEITKYTAAGIPTGVAIDGEETPQGSLQLDAEIGPAIYLAQIAVDSSAGENAGDLYVTNVAEEGVVDKFGESGQYLCQITGSETPSPSECNGVAGSDTPAGSMAPTGVVVGANGDVYVSDAVHDVVDVFGAKGEYITQYADPKEDPGALAINAAGDLYIANGGIEPTGIVELSTEEGGSVVSAPELEASEASAVAVDRATGEVLTTSIFSGAYADFDSSGTELLTFGEGGMSIAIDEASDEVYTKSYLGKTSTSVIVFGAFVLEPNEVTTAAASEVDEETATLHGQVTPDPRAGGEISECVFEYGTSAAYGQTAPCEQSVPFPAGGEVSTQLHISPSTTYHFRLRAKDTGNGSDGAGSTDGADATFTTPGPASIENKTATAAATEATVRALVNPFGFATTCEVQYVDEAGFEASGYADASTVPCVSPEVSAGFTAKSMSAVLTGLHINTTYHYRFVVTNASRAKTTVGADETFATFGIKSFGVEVLGAGGKISEHNGYPLYEGPAFTQAGGHPYALITSFELNATQVPVSNATTETQTDANVRDVITELPPGLVGNATVLPRCTPGELTSGECSGAAQVGVITVLSGGYQPLEKASGLYNIVPPSGTPVELGANIANDAIVYVKANVRTGGDYGVTAEVRNASTDVGVTGATVELWGVPGDKSHDEFRRCPDPGHTLETGPCAANAAAVPFLSNPTSCTGSQTAKLRVDSWQASGEYVQASSTLPATTGCGRLSFSPSISLLPDTSAADSPSGVLVKLHVPQDEAPGGLATPSLRNAVVSLPAGMTLNPAAANGLEACSQEQFGLHSESEPECPDASKVGSVEIETPLLADRLLGSVYLAEQNNNPFDSTFALYIAAQGDGSLVKVAGKVEADPLTGQLTGSFDENPDLPFSDFRLHFFGGPRAPLATPKVCGTYTTTSVLTPWSAPESGPAVTPSMPFQITTGAGGSPCSTPGFAPSITAGTTSNQAGGFSPFTLTLGRNDGEQNLGTVQAVMAPGLAGMLAKVPLCGEPQASEGTCPAVSQIGHVATGVGVGRYPLFVPTPGAPQDPVYLTGPYDGAPFGLSVVVRPEAGPFNLSENGKPVVVRARVNIDPADAHVTVTSDPLPQILKGVPLDIRDVLVTIDHPEFIVNPTTCERLQLAGSVTSGLGTPATISAPLQASVQVPFQVTNCAALKFGPKFAVSTSGKTSKADGASLTATVKEPAGALGTQANIASVKVELPKVLPSRLSTLQKACTSAQFDANPAGCPPASDVGYAVVHTPLLPVPLEGPAIFVSHGAEAFPSLTLVLQGDNIKIDLVGTTFISKANVTSTTFKTVPDEPFETFSLTLHQGPYSALAAVGNLCHQSLAMPAAFVAQDGATFNEDAHIEVTGCSNAITVVSKKLKGQMLTLAVAVPAAGRLTATGEGLAKGTKSSSDRETIAIKLRVTKHGRFTSEVKLRFVSRSGKHLAKSVKVNA